MKIRGITQSVLAISLLLAFTGCGDDAPTELTLDPPDITGTWRFSWTINESYFTTTYVIPLECAAVVDFTISGEATNLSATQVGSEQLTCDDGTSFDLEAGTLRIRFSSWGSMTLQASWPFDTTFEAQATLTGGSQSAMAGVGRWSYVEDEDFGFRRSLIGVFTADLVP